MFQSPAPALLVACLCATVSLGAQKLTAEQLVSEHLAVSLPAASGAGDQRLEVRGSCATTSPARAAGQLVGTFRLASGGESSRLTLRFDNDRYEGEDVTFEAGEVEIGFAQPRTSSRSALGNFLAVNRVIVGEGMLGGVLNARWPLRHLSRRQAKVQYDGMKKLHGRDLHRLRYRAKQGQRSLEIHLYFEPDTYRHVASVYATSQTQALGFGPESSSRESDQHFRLEETFSDFVPVGDQMLPRSWTLRYERSANTSTEWKYELTVESVDDRQVPTRQALFEAPRRG